MKKLVKNMIGIIVGFVLIALVIISTAGVKVSNREENIIYISSDVRQNYIIDIDEFSELDNVYEYLLLDEVITDNKVYSVKGVIIQVDKDLVSEDTQYVCVIPN